MIKCQGLQPEHMLFYILSDACIDCCLHCWSVTHYHLLFVSVAGSKHCREKKHKHIRSIASWFQACFTFWLLAPCFHQLTFVLCWQWKCHVSPTPQRTGFPSVMGSVGSCTHWKQREACCWIQGVVWSSHRHKSASSVC